MIIVSLVRTPTPNVPTIASTVPKEKSISVEFLIVAAGQAIADSHHFRGRLTD